MRAATGTRSAGAEELKRLGAIARPRGSCDSERDADDGVIQSPYHPAPMADDVRVRLWETGGRWYAHILDAPAFIEVTGTSRDACIRELRAVTGNDVTLTIEVIPQIVGVAEAAEIMGWDKRRVVDIPRPRAVSREPLRLASGRIWLREDIEAYADEWRQRHPHPTGEPSH